LDLGQSLKRCLPPPTPQRQRAMPIAFDPRRGLAVHRRLLVLVLAGLGLGGVGHGLERGHEGGEAPVGRADGGEELLERLVLVGGDAVGDEAEALGGRRETRWPY